MGTIKEKGMTMEITYKKIPQSDKEQVLSLINTVIGGLNNPDFFIPYEPWEYDSMFDEENYAYLFSLPDNLSDIVKAINWSV